ncbi:MAG: DUF2381 family protein [Cystobacter sp.]
MLASVLTILALHQIPSEGGVRSSCPDRVRVDLSARASLPTPEICISAGILTGFIFDRPVSIDLQDEVRFGEVLRGRAGISLVPPSDLTSGERLRLSIHFEQDPPEKKVTFVLVSYPGQATHQVDVFHDSRSQDSLRHELWEERLNNVALREENQTLREELRAARRLRQVFLSGELRSTGIASKKLPIDPAWRERKPIAILQGTSFKAARSLAVWISVANNGPQPWAVEDVRLTDANGERLQNLDPGPPQTIPPFGTGDVFIELSDHKHELTGEFSLTMREKGPHSMTMPHITFPQQTMQSN